MDSASSADGRSYRRLQAAGPPADLQKWEGRVGTLEAAMGLFTPRHKTTADVGDGAPAGDEGDKHCESPDSSFCGSGFFGALQAAKLYVGAPGMNSICERLLAAEPNVTVETYCRVTRVDWDGEQRTWRLDGLRGQSLDHSKEGNTPYFLGTFDALVVADVMAGTPGTPGTLNIDQEYHPLEKHFSAMAGDGAGSGAAWMVQFTAILTFSWSDVDTWGMLEQGRGRDDGHECWVVVSSADFALRMVQAMPLSIDGKYNPQTQVYLDSIAPKLLAAFQIVSHLTPVAVSPVVDLAQNEPEICRQYNDIAADPELGDVVRVLSPKITQSHTASTRRART
eukprot:gene6015-7227_t